MQENEKSSRKYLLFFNIKTIWVFLLFLSLQLSFAQSTTGIALSWNKSVGCQTYGEEGDPRDGKEPVFLEDIGSSDCIKVCEFSYVTYTLSGLPMSYTTVWQANGGTVSSSSNTSCNVTWGSVGSAGLTLTITTDTGNIITKNICFDKIQLPTALFNVVDNNESPDNFGCTNQNIYFTNLSQNNGGSALVSYYWNFGDGTTSSAFEPVHVYTVDKEYTVKLTVTNACNCSQSYKQTVFIKGSGFDITCPSVVCENSNEIYSLPFDGKEICHNNFNWSVIGGDIVNQGGGNVEVLWNNIGNDGFGYVTFDPKDCNLDCLSPSTIKVPVIQAKGFIDGPTDICLGDQVRFKLPQWPTTDFQWQIAGDPNEAAVNIILTDQRNEVVLEPLALGSYTLIATYMNTLLQCGGTARLTFNVTQPLEIIGENNICQNDFQTYTTINSDYTDWTLMNAAGSVVATAQGFSFDYNFETAGNYTLVAGTAALCPFKQFKITVVPQPVITSEIIEGELVPCPNTSYTYSVANADPNFYYTWSVQNGSTIGGSLGTQVNVTFNGTSPASVSVVKMSYNPAFCSSEPFVQDVTIKKIRADVSNTNLAVCANSVASYQANISGTSTLYTEGDSYVWTLSNPSLGSINGQGTNSISITWNNLLTTTTVDLVLVIKKCTIIKTITKTITIYPNPIISISTSNSTVCPGASVYLNLTSTVPLTGSFVVNWTINGATYPGTVGSTMFTHQFPNVSSSNLTTNVSAVINNVPGCSGSTNTATLAITVLPKPPATASFTGENAFCEPTGINTVLVVSSSMTNVNIQWYKDGVAIPGAINATYTVPQTSAGFGSYTFIATSTITNCQTTSNNVGVTQLSCIPLDCTLPQEPNLTNTSSFDCGKIVLVGSTDVAPISPPYFDIVGPTSSLNVTAPFVNVTLPGVYHVLYTAKYICQNNGQVVKKQLNENVIVPYIPKIGYTATCSGNNTFAITFIDQTNYIVGIPISSPSLQFAYKLVTDSVFTVVSGNTATLSTGNYIFRIIVGGTVYGQVQPSCESLLSANLAGVPAANITVSNLNCHDSPVQFGFNIPMSSTNNYLWTFEPGVTNTLASPQRVFNTSGAKTVTVKVTNALGCSDTFSTTIIIPEPCFSGNISSTPPNATVCQGQSVRIDYTPSMSMPNNCTPTYVWMNGNLPALGATNSPTYFATAPGFYWLKLVNGSCKYNCPELIKPIFNIAPMIKLVVPSTACQGETITVTAITTVSDITWTIDGVLQPSANGQAQPQFTMNTMNAHTISATVTSNGCSNTASQIINVNAVPGPVSITSTLISCNPFKYQLTATAASGATFNWSNGETNNPLIVTQGGPYKVTATSGGCSESTQIDVPKSPSEYMWIFPSGCFNNCLKDVATLIGPRLPLVYWGWLLDGSVMSSGNNSFPEPFSIGNNTGSYQLRIKSGQCELTSEPLNYTANDCENCKIDRVVLESVNQLQYPYCAFSVSLIISSSYPTDVQVTLGSENGNIIVQPAGFNLLSGNNPYSFTFVPLDDLASGSVDFFITYTDVEGNICVTRFKLDIPTCNENNGGSKFVQESSNVTKEIKSVVTMYPNPAKELVTIAYENISASAMIEVYDLTGRLLSHHNAQSQTGNWQLNTSNYPGGIYVVVVKDNNQIIVQHKLVIE
ncbi:PKD domain-containing protein [Flavobacterium terrigena]|uniref:Por secretion system C-terminal sorting domain-containing protein n=1 Tax=Flavobacterium terrigena TaxID=402734 RepID=A0A1H6XWA1_9FLAO|nr:PKD domain-containing protein [Flavobacterium terrigena]SEJ32446.1 Por secretion system C-terminal sorting domain-containing protein [Flavobacterium terrigena]